MMIAHSVLWLCSAIADERPLALVIDDAQWADRCSLQVLSYLARRVDDLRLLIAVGARADDPDAASDLLSLLGGVRAATVLRPQPLTTAGGVRLLRRLAPGAPVSVRRDCHRSAGEIPGCWVSSGARSPPTTPRRSTIASSRKSPSARSLATSSAGAWLPSRSATERSPRHSR